MPELDVLAIGGGAAGLTIAIGGSGLGLRVALVERHHTGGECTCTGCVPSKALLHVGAIAAAAQRAAAWSSDGWDGRSAVDGAPLDFAMALAHVRGARTAIGAEESPDALRRRGIALLEGTARLRPRTDGTKPKDGHVVEVDGRPVTARHVVIATGSTPALPPLPGLETVRSFTNETIFDELEALPSRLAVIGGGPVGCELSQAFARLGSQVTLLQSQDRLLPREEPCASSVLAEALRREGVVVHTSATISKIIATPGTERGATLLVEGIGQVSADAVLVATGRRARTEGAGLENAGIALAHNGNAVDAHLQTSVSGDWAIGDCVGPHRFTHAAEQQGRVVLRNILFPWKKQHFDDRVLPWATFTDPEVGHVGLTEQQARERYGNTSEATTLPLDKVDRAVTDGATEGFIKLILQGHTILGAHIVAPRAGELIQEVALAMQHRLPVSVLSMVHIYPAYAYGLHQAADRIGLERMARGGLAGRVLPVVRRLALRGIG